MTKIAITTVNWNRKADTLDWLKSLKRLDTNSLVTRTFISSNEDFKGDFELILNKRNLGFTGGTNTVARTALAWDADYLLMMNNDTLVKSPDLLKKLLETAQKPNFGVVSPKILFAPGFEYYKNRYSKSDLSKVIWYAGGHFDWNNVMSVHRGIDEIDKGKYDLVEETTFVNGACILVDAKIFKQGIFFDEKLFAYFDDNDWTQRVKKAGFKTYYDGRVAIYHKVSQTAGIGSGISDYYIPRNRLIFGMRYAPLRTKFNLLQEAFRLLIHGRPNQKLAIKDFFLGKRGALGHQIVS